MGFTAAELTKDGNLKIAGNLNTRLPVITDGLVAHFPFDGGGGAFDSVGGYQTIQNVETGVNLIEAMNLDWRDPKSWESNSGMSWDNEKQALKIVGYHNTWLKTPIIVDPNKHYQVSIEVMEEVQSNTGLYLGGYMTNAAGQRVTTNYDYSYAANAQPATGVWTKYCVTRYGSGNQIDRTSTTFDNVSGWMGTNTGVTDKMTKYYYYGGLFNYSSGGVMYIRNLNITIMDNDISNCAISNNGISTEESTTNLLSGIFDTTFESFDEGSDVGFSNQLGTGNTLSVSKDMSYSGCKSLKVIKGTDNSGRCYKTIAVNSGQNFTVSAMVYSLTPGSYISIEFNGGNYSWSVSQLRNTHKGTGWELLWASITSPATSNTTGYYFYHPSHTNVTYVDNIQIENKNFATSHIVGSRNSSGYIDIEGLKLNNFSLAFKFKPNTQYYNISSSSYNKTMLTMYDVDTTRMIYYRDYTSTPSQSLTSSSPFFDLEPDSKWDNKMHHLHHSCGYKTLQSHYYFITKSGSILRIFIVLEDGTILSNSSTTYSDSTLLNDFVLTKLRLGYSDNNVWCGEFSDFSIYNRALSDSEIKQLYAPAFELKTNGSLINSGIISKPNLPSDVYYFPLGFDSKDENKFISCSSDTNAIYRDGMAWVGNSIINLYRQAAFDNDFDAKGNGIIAVSKYSDIEIEFIYDYSQNLASTYHGQTITIISGNQYLASMDVYISPDANIAATGSTFVANMEGGCSTNFTYDNTKKGQWQHIEKLVTATSTTTRLYLYPSTATIYATTGLLKFKNVMVTNTTFPVPFINGSIGAGKLQYNLNSSIGLNWSGNWSIGYWKMPVGTHSNLTGYSLESLGCNSNSVGGGYSWWGKDNGSNILSGSTPSTITPSTYFNNWQFVILRKNGTNIIIDTYLFDGTKSTRTQALGTSLANYYVTQYGYDLFLGGWDNSNVCNTYFRDLIVAKRYLSDDEVLNIYNNKMEHTNKNILRIQNSIYTGQVL